MDLELDVVRQINKLAGQAPPVDLMMDLITRYGHWAFLIYGICYGLRRGRIKSIGGRAAWRRSLQSAYAP